MARISRKRPDHWEIALRPAAAGKTPANGLTTLIDEHPHDQSRSAKRVLGDNTLLIARAGAEFAEREATIRMQARWDRDRTSTWPGLAH